MNQDSQCEFSSSSWLRPCSHWEQAHFISHTLPTGCLEGCADPTWGPYSISTNLYNLRHTADRRQTENYAIGARCHNIPGNWLVAQPDAVYATLAIKASILRCSHLKQGFQAGDCQALRHPPPSGYASEWVLAVIYVVFFVDIQFIYYTTMQPNVEAGSEGSQGDDTRDSMHKAEPCIERTEMVRLRDLLDFIPVLKFA